jgi:hypothetical protein
MTIKIRQRACRAEEALVNTKMTKMQESIQQFEDLQTRRKEMMKTALTTAELIEPVPRSVLLASLTNNLPTGMSLLKLNLVQKEPVRVPGDRGRRTGTSGQGQGAGRERTSVEKSLETQMDIEGMAPSDLQVSQYMESLGNSILIDRVALIESVEKKMGQAAFRHFRLTAMLRREVHLTKEDVDGIRSKAERSVYQF